MEVVQNKLKINVRSSCGCYLFPSQSKLNLILVNYKQYYQGETTRDHYSWSNYSWSTVSIGTTNAASIQIIDETIIDEIGLTSLLEEIPLDENRNIYYPVNIHKQKQFFHIS